MGDRRVNRYNKRAHAIRPAKHACSIHNGRGWFWEQSGGFNLKVFWIWQISTTISNHPSWASELPWMISRREELYAYVNTSSLAIPREEVGMIAVRIARQAIEGQR
jgi:hypothetical protein